MNDDLRDIVEGRFDVVPAVQMLALRLLQAEQDLARLVMVAGSVGVDALPEAVATTKQRPSKKAAT